MPTVALTDQSCHSFNVVFLRSLASLDLLTRYQRNEQEVNHAPTHEISNGWRRDLRLVCNGLRTRSHPRRVGFAIPCMVTICARRHLAPSERSDAAPTW